MLVRHTITSLRLSYSRSTKGGRVSAKYRRALALTSVLVISTSILTPPVCPTPRLGRFRLPMLRLREPRLLAT